jgi:urease gamma subunit
MQYYIIWVLSHLYIFLLSTVSPYHQCTYILENKTSYYSIRYINHSLHYLTFSPIHHKVGFLAQKRLARGLQLNQTEAIALIASQLQERIRDGHNSVAELMQHGKAILGRRHVLPSVPALLHAIQVEGSFHDGSAFIAIVSPLLY